MELFVIAYCRSSFSFLDAWLWKKGHNFRMAAAIDSKQKPIYAI